MATDDEELEDQDILDGPIEHILLGAARGIQDRNALLDRVLRDMERMRADIETIRMEGECQVGSLVSHWRKLPPGQQSTKVRLPRKPKPE